VAVPGIVRRQRCHHDVTARRSVLGPKRPRAAIELTPRPRPGTQFPDRAAPIRLETRPTRGLLLPTGRNHAS
jgi:hypothetical protein